MQAPCEKAIQYEGIGYCSVKYAAAGDQQQPRIYAVCDHRLDGAPVQEVLRDAYGETRSDVRIIDEVVQQSPRTSYDFVAFRSTPESAVTNPIVIEAQALDLRGGGVRPAWEAWKQDDIANWRKYFTEESGKLNRRDRIDYGVNMANIYKRLAVQIANKGSFLRDIGVPLYVVMQHRPFEYLKSRVPFTEVRNDADWDITYITFDYTGETSADGRMEFVHHATSRTTLDDYASALFNNPRGDSSVSKNSFLHSVKRKAGLAH